MRSSPAKHTHRAMMWDHHHFVVLAPPPPGGPGRRAGLQVTGHDPHGRLLWGSTQQYNTKQYINRQYIPSYRQYSQGRRQYSRSGRRAAQDGARQGARAGWEAAGVRAGQVPAACGAVRVACCGPAATWVGACAGGFWSPGPTGAGKRNAANVFCLSFLPN